MHETSYTDPFWDSLEDGSFLIHACEECGNRFFPPRPVCPYCQSTTVAWEETTGTGILYSFTRQHVTAPGFDDELIAGVIELDEGPRLLAPIDEPYEDLQIGDQLRIEPDEYSHDYDRGWLEEYPFYVATLIDD